METKSRNRVLLAQAYCIFNSRKADHGSQHRAKFRLLEDASFTLVYAIAYTEHDSPRSACHWFHTGLLLPTGLPCVALPTIGLAGSRGLSELALPLPPLLHLSRSLMASTARTGIGGAGS